MTSETPPPPDQPKTTDKVKNQAKKVYNEGQARRFVVTHKGRTLVDLSLLVAIILAIFGPFAAVLGLVLAVVTGCEIQFTAPPPADEDAATGELPPASDEETLAT